MTYDNAGGCLAHERKSRGVKANDLAAQCGISPQFLCDVEKGFRRPTVEVARKLIDALGCGPVVSLRLRRGWSKPDVESVAAWEQSTWDVHSKVPNPIQVPSDVYRKPANTCEVML